MTALDICAAHARLPITVAYDDETGAWSMVWATARGSRVSWVIGPHAMEQMREQYLQVRAGMMALGGAGP